MLLVLTIILIKATFLLKYGILLATLKLHTTLITGITRIDDFNDVVGDFIAVSSSERLLSVNDFTLNIKVEKKISKNIIFIGLEH